MQKFNNSARIIVSPEKLTELRLDVAMRRRALMINATAYGMRHGDQLRAFAAAMLRPAERVALADVLTALASGERWTDATTRRLKASLAPLRRHARFSPKERDEETGLTWHLDRLSELIAQHEVLRHREAMLSMATTDRSVSPRSRSGKRGRSLNARAGRGNAAGTSAA